MASAADNTTLFETAIENLINIGVYDFLLPFLIVSLIIFALLKKSHMLGDSVGINGIIAVSIGLLFIGFPLIVGFSLTTEITTFLLQSTVWIFLMITAVIIAAVFYPNVGAVLGEKLKSSGLVWLMLAIVIGLFVTSGLVGVFTNIGNPIATGIEADTPSPNSDIVIIVAALIIFMVLMIIVALISGKLRR